MSRWLSSRRWRCQAFLRSRHVPRGLENRPRDGTVARLVAQGVGPGALGFDDLRAGEDYGEEAQAVATVRRGALRAESSGPVATAPSTFEVREAGGAGVAGLAAVWESA
jgi:hypothetical protein